MLILKVIGGFFLMLLIAIVVILLIAIANIDDRGMETVICRNCKRPTCEGCTRLDDLNLN